MLCWCEVLRSSYRYLCVCLSVCSHISKTACPYLRNRLYMLPVAVARSSSDNSAICHVLPVRGWRHVFT